MRVLYRCYYLYHYHIIVGVGVVVVVVVVVVVAYVLTNTARIRNVERVNTRQYQTNQKVHNIMLFTAI